MKRIFKILLGLVGGLILLAILAAVLLPVIYDKDDLERAIANEVHKQTGRELRIDGQLDFSVFPWVAVEVGDLTLSNAAGFGDQPFAHIGRARVGVALVPLFKKQLVADEITLDGLQLALMVNAKGKNNWDDLAEAGNAEPDSADEIQDSGAGLFSSQQIAGLNIRDSLIEYQDQQAGTHYRLANFSIQTGALGDAKPVPVKLALLLEDLIGGSRMEIDLNAKTKLDFVEQIHTFDAIKLEIRQKATSTQGDKEINEEPMVIHAPGLRVNMTAQALTMDVFTANLAGLEVTGNLEAKNILDDPAFDGTMRFADFSPRKVMQALSMDAPITADPTVLQQAHLTATFKGSGSQLTLSDVQLELDQSKFVGELSVRNFDQPGIRFDFDVDAIDIDRYLEPASNEKVEADVAIPQDELQDLDLQGSLRVGALQLAGLDLTNAVVGLTIKKGKLQLNPLTAGFYDGSYSGNIMLDSSGTKPVISLDEKLNSVTFQRMLADLTDSENLSGTARVHVRLTGSGVTSNEVVSSLKGDLGLTLDEGALEGINIWYEIRRGYALYKGLAAPEPEPRRTVFSHLQLDAFVENGVLTTRTLIGELPFLSLRGNGMVDLGQSNVDLRLTATVRSVPELSQDPLGSELKGQQLPFKVTGALDDPKVAVDWEALLKGEATDLLLDKLGLKSKPETSDEAADAKEEETSPKDDTKDAAKGILLDLLGGKKKKKDKNGDEDEKDGE